MGDERDLRDAARSAGTSDPAHRILLAARQVIAQRGLEQARISDIARAAKVARGAIFYYFGTKERLVIEVLRTDGEARLASLRRHLGPASSLDELVEGMVEELASFTDSQHGPHLLAQQIDGAAASSDELRAARHALRVRWRQELTAILREKAATGIIQLPVDPDVVATLLTCLGHGIANELISDPEWHPQPTIALGAQLARSILAPPQPQPRS